MHVIVVITVHTKLSFSSNFMSVAHINKILRVSNDFSLSVHFVCDQSSYTSPASNVHLLNYMYYTIEPMSPVQPGVRTNQIRVLQSHDIKNAIYWHSLIIIIGL